VHFNFVYLFTEIAPRMTKSDIVNLLEKKHQELFNLIENQPPKKWMSGPENKWTFGQHILHLTDSIQLLNKALSYPKFILKYKFGTSNRENRTYDIVVKKYREKLAANQERAKQFNIKLKTPSLKEKSFLVNKLKIQNKKLQYKTNKWKDKDLDTLLIPHPLMGRMTVREIIMWSAHHTEHHIQILNDNY
ncbi:MAG: hypothetical protein ACI8WA_001376, partial [Polaribacter sp.]